MHVGGGGGAAGGGGARPAAVVGGHPHYLCSSVRNFTCDRCRTNYTKTAVWACLPCNYDECGTCFQTSGSKKAPNCKKCRKDLIQMKPASKTGTYDCHQCRKPRIGHAYYCQLDSIIICSQCMHT